MHFLDVSIHAPRAGRDSLTGPSSTTETRFNPRAPRGARQPEGTASTTETTVSIHAPRAGRDMMNKWLSTGYLVSIHAPRAGRDPMPRPGCSVSLVSIHAPRAGRDAAETTCLSASASFNPRAPRGARHAYEIQWPTIGTFQSTRPARGATLDLAGTRAMTGFQSTRPARGATVLLLKVSADGTVSIHAPRAGRDRRPQAGIQPNSAFQSTRPARGATTL